MPSIRSGEIPCQDVTLLLEHIAQNEGFVSGFQGYPCTAWKDVEWRLVGVESGSPCVLRRDPRVSLGGIPESLGGIPEPSAPRGAAGDARPLGTHLLQSWQTPGKTGTKKKNRRKAIWGNNMFLILAI